MIPSSPLLPDQASDVAKSVDHLMLFALSGLVVFSALIANVCFVAGGVVAAAGVALAVIPLVTGDSGRASLMVGPSSVTYAVTF